MRWFLNLATRSKLSIGFGLILLLFLAAILTAFGAMIAVRAVERDLNDILAVRLNLNGERAQLFLAMLTTGEARATAIGEAAVYVRVNNAIVERLHAESQAEPKLARSANALIALHDEQSKTRDEKIIPAIQAAQTPEQMAVPQALLVGEQAEGYEQMRAILRGFTTDVTARADARRRAAQTAIIALAVMAVGAALALVLGLNRLLARPLEKLTGVADKIARGEIGVELAVDDRKDEVGGLMRAFQRMSRALTAAAGRARQIADGDLTAQWRPQSADDVFGHAFAEMADRLRPLLQEVTSAVNVLASSATQIKASTSELAATAAQTAVAVSETTTTVEEVKQTANVSSQRARTVSEQAQKAADVAQGGRRAVEQTIEGMEDIRRQMDSVAASILGLNAQSQAIAEIIASVADLAAQSKLLALNASIEAAKAGEEGRGFSVVAQEVKSLAEQSKQATTQVRAILGDIQKATTGAVLATEQGNKAVEAGLQQSTGAGDSIGELAENIAAAAQAALQIAATSQEQFVGMDQVATAMENIKNASTQTVTSTRQAEAAAQELHELGQKLKTLLERFKV